VLRLWTQQRCCYCMGVSATARAQRTFLKLLGGWERGDKLSASLVFSPWAPARGPPRHTFWLLTCAEALTTTPSRASVSVLSSKLADSWFSGRRAALRCGSKSGVANVHHPHGCEAGCVSTIPGSQGDTALLTTHSVFTQERRNAVTSVQNPESCGLCRLRRPKGAAQSFLQRSLLPISPVWLLLRRTEN